MSIMIKLTIYEQEAEGGGDEDGTGIYMMI